MTKTEVLVELQTDIYFMFTELPDPKVIGSMLENEEWKEPFLESIERLIAEQREELKSGDKKKVGQTIDRILTSMQITADGMREKYPKGAELLDKARKKLASVLS